VCKLTATAVVLVSQEKAVHELSERGCRPLCLSYSVTMSKGRVREIENLVRGKPPTGYV